MKNKFLSGIIMLGIIFCLSSCSKDDDGPSDPQGTITLNMMNEDNGKTILEDSDIYIDKANNFVGYSTYVVQLGAVKGLGSISKPVLKAFAEQVAVVPGNGYQFFRQAAIQKFPSGVDAVVTAADYYNLYVESLIVEGGTVTGATVKYIPADIPDYGLPDYGTDLGVLNSNNPSITIELPTSDFEYFDDNDINEIDFVKKGNKLTINLVECIYSESFGIYIRVKETFTALHCYVDW